MYSSLYQFTKEYLLPGAKEIRRCAHELECTEWLSRSELEEVQLKKLQRLVSYAYEYVPFYRERYRREDIHPQDIKGLKDFQALPCLTRDDVLNHREALLSTVYRGRTFEDTTGGSTGQPMRFIMDVAALLGSYAAETRCRGWYGVRPGDKMAWVWGNLKDFPGWHWRARLAARIRRRRYLNSRTLDEDKMQDFAEMLLKWQPTMFKAYPSALYLFARYLKKQGIAGIRPRLIEVGGEKMTPPQRQLLEEVFQAPVADYYGSWEAGLMSYQCPQGSSHVIEDHYLELVSSGQVANPGQMGEVVITPLSQYAMPFIRYKNDDVGIYESGDCSCGRGMPVLREVVGRNSDWLVSPDGNIVHWSSFYTIIRYKPEVYQYQLYQSDREHLEVRLVCRQRVAPSLLEDIRNELQPCFGEGMHIAIKLVDRIELTPAGKHRFIISEVKPDFI